VVDIPISQNRNEEITPGRKVYPALLFQAAGAAHNRKMQIVTLFNCSQGNGYGVVVTDHISAPGCVMVDIQVPFFRDQVVANYHINSLRHFINLLIRGRTVN
jgi:hypothetical protein